MANELFQFMSEQSVATFVNQLFKKTGVRLDERIVQELNENSSDKQNLSAKALYELLNALNEVDTGLLERVNANGETLGQNAQSITDLNTKQDEQDGRLDTVEGTLGTTSNLMGTFQHLEIATVTGSIDTVVNPNDTTLYLQRDNEADTTWKMYVYQEPEVEYPEFSLNDIVYSSIDGGNAISVNTLTDEAYTSVDKIVIPSSIDNVPVTQLLLKFGQLSSLNNTLETVYIPKSIKSLYISLDTYTKIRNIYYEGSEEEWNAINHIQNSNNNSSLITKHFNYTGEIIKEASWIDVGDTELDLSVIWSKDETEEMREALQVHDAEPIPFNDIMNLVDEAFNANQIDYRMEPEGEVEVPNVEYGTKLSDVEIRGTMMYDGVEVPGTFTWETTDEEFEQMMNSES